MKITHSGNSKYGVHLLHGTVPFPFQTGPVSDVWFCFAVLKDSQKFCIQTVSATLYAANSHWEAKTIPEEEDKHKKCSLSGHHVKCHREITPLLLQSKEDLTQSDLSVHWSLQWTWNPLSMAKIMLPLSERYCIENYKKKQLFRDRPLRGMKTTETSFHLSWKA